jgi:hypothetical protein
MPTEEGRTDRMKFMKQVDLFGESRRMSVQVNLALFPGFLAALFVLPAVLHSQWITGPVVNAVLFLAAVLLGPLQAAALGTLPAMAALAAGLLPLPLAPMVPFIVFGNWAMVWTAHYLKERGLVTAVALAAAVKFAVIYAAFLLVYRALPGGLLSEGVAVMMAWPQLVTALAGGAIALGVLALVRRPARGR